MVNLAPRQTPPERRGRNDPRSLFFSLRHARTRAVASPPTVIDTSIAEAGMTIAGTIASLWRRLAAVFFAPAPAPDPKPALKSASPTYERDRKRVWRAKKPSRQCPDVSRDRPGTVPGHVPDTLKERKKEERREREARAHIPENWK